MRTLVGFLAALALVVGGSGVATLVFERRLAALAPDGVDFASLRFDPLSGRVDVRDLVARDAGGRVIFRAAALRARAGALAVLTGTLALRQVEIDAPVVRLRSGAPPVLSVLAGMPSAAAITLEGVMVNDGSLLLDRAEPGAEALEIRHVNLRMSRLDAETADLAFAVDLAVYGAIVRVTGQPIRAPGPGGVPRIAGYAVRARGQGVDVAAALRDFPVTEAFAVTRATGDVDLTLLLVDGAPLVSGAVRVGALEARVDEPGLPKLVAEGASVTLDRFDVQRRTGAIARVELVRPQLDLRDPARVGVALRRVATRLDDAGAHVRRVRLTGATLRLPGVVLRNVDATAHAVTDAPDAWWRLNGQGTVGRSGVVAVRGVLGRDLGAFDGLVRVRNVPVGPWRRPLGLGDWDGVLAFEGRVRMADGGGETVRALAEGDARFSALRSGTAGRFPSDVARLHVRRFEWPAALGEYEVSPEDQPFRVTPARAPDLGEGWVRDAPAAGAMSLGTVLGALAASVRDAAGTPAASPAVMAPGAEVPPATSR